MDLTVPLMLLAYASVVRTAKTTTFTSFRRVENRKIITNVTTTTANIPNALHCCLLCKTTSNCSSVSYNEQQGLCIQSVVVATEKHVVPELGWIMYHEADSVDGCFQGSCYKLVTEEHKWHDAQAHCKQTGGHLADITTAEENNFIINMVDKQEYQPYYLRRGSISLGANDFAAKGVFVWSDGSRVSDGFHNWVTGQPDNGSGSGEESCVEMVPMFTHKLNDVPCTLKCWSICEYD